MPTIVDRKPETTKPENKKSCLFQVWIDLNFGEGNPDWWWNSAPKELAHALDESAKVKSEGWVSIVMPDGLNPRPDGRWDNP